MNCKNCNTRIQRRDTVCPHCGRKPAEKRPGSPPVAMPRARPKLAPAVADEPALELDCVVESLDSEPVASPAPMEVRALLASRPEWLEPGLALLQGGQDAVGVATEVGEIDLLLVDPNGDLRVVLIPEVSDIDRALVQILPRMGWVARHRAEQDCKVQGIVLLADVPTETVYAATAISDRVSFRSYQLALRIDPIEL